MTDEIDERLREAARAALSFTTSSTAGAIDRALRFREIVDAARAYLDVTPFDDVDAAADRLRRALPTKGGG